MAEMSLAYFMKESNKEREIVEIPGVDSYRDKDGNIIPFRVKVLNQKEIDKIYEKWRKKEIVKEKNGRPLVDRGSVVYDNSLDANRALRDVIVNALEFPNLKDEKLRKFYECEDVTDMPLLVFPKRREYDQVVRDVLSVLGIGEDEEPEEKDRVEVEEAKN